MTTLLNRVLRKLHILSQPFDEDDMINASIEDKERHHRSLVGQLASTLIRRESLNDELRESIKIAREQTNSFADFETLTIRRKDQRNV
jgi:hypothetical protein